ncbi:hypothetical protein niasHS_018010 [Heterodera schachtii]|uniref:Ubiquitin-like domain-containing protein n=1 Tax=Heterodera schachtii TaxID=97005 RepID=A0ABD2HWX3_HETSC
MKPFGNALFSVGISAGLITMFMLMIMPSSTDGIKINVEYGDIKFRIEVNKMNKVKELKWKIESYTRENKIGGPNGIRSEGQMLIWQTAHGNVPLINDEEWLKDYGIRNNATVFLALNGLFPVWFTHHLRPESLGLFVHVKASETIATVKERIKEKIKESIIGQLHIQSGDIKLQYWNSQEYVPIIDENQTIGDYGIEEDGYLRVEDDSSEEDLSVEDDSSEEDLSVEDEEEQ